MVDNYHPHITFLEENSFRSLHKDIQYDNFYYADRPRNSGSNGPYRKLILRLADSQRPVYHPEIAVVKISKEQGTYTACNRSKQRACSRRHDNRSRDTCRRRHGDRTGTLDKTHCR